MHAPPIVNPALELRRALVTGGALFTPWAEAQCGQAVTADVERENPPYLLPAEAADLGLADPESRAAVRRRGWLLQEDGARVARISSTVSVGRGHQVDPALIKLLNTTSVPLGTALGAHGRSRVLWCEVGITEYAVTCARLISYDDVPLALTTDKVLWSWLAGLRGSTWG